MVGFHPPKKYRAAFLVSVALAIVPLPFGFIEEDIAVIAGIWGLYFVVPMALVVAAAWLGVRYRVPRVWLRVAVVLIGTFLLLWFAYWSLWVPPLGLLALLPALVIVRAGVFAWRGSG